MPELGRVREGMGRVQIGRHGIERLDVEAELKTVGDGDGHEPGRVG